jgi:hypothetical protein
MLPLQGNQKNAPTSDSRVPLLREREELLAKPKATVAFEQRREPLKQNKTDRLSAFLLLFLSFAGRQRLDLTLFCFISLSTSLPTPLPVPARVKMSLFAIVKCI